MKDRLPAYMVISFMTCISMHKIELDFDEVEVYDSTELL